MTWLLAWCGAMTAGWASIMLGQVRSGSPIVLILGGFVLVIVLLPLLRVLQSVRSGVSVDLSAGTVTVHLPLGFRSSVTMLSCAQVVSCIILSGQYDVPRRAPGPAILSVLNAAMARSTTRTEHVIALCLADDDPPLVVTPARTTDPYSLLKAARRLAGLLQRPLETPFNPEMGRPRPAQA